MARSPPDKSGYRLNVTNYTQIAGTSTDRSRIGSPEPSHKPPCLSSDLATSDQPTRLTLMIRAGPGVEETAFSMQFTSPSQPNSPQPSPLPQRRHEPDGLSHPDVSPTSTTSGTLLRRPRVETDHGRIRTSAVDISNSGECRLSPEGRLPAIPTVTSTTNARFRPSATPYAPKRAASSSNVLQNANFIQIRQPFEKPNPNSIFLPVEVQRVTTPKPRARFGMSVSPTTTGRPLSATEALDTGQKHPVLDMRNGLIPQPPQCSKPNNSRPSTPNGHSNNTLKDSLSSVSNSLVPQPPKSGKPSGMRRGQKGNPSLSANVNKDRTKPSQNTLPELHRVPLSLHAVTLEQVKSSLLDLEKELSESYSSKMMPAKKKRRRKLRFIDPASLRHTPVDGSRLSALGFAPTLSPDGSDGESHDNGPINVVKYPPDSRHTRAGMIGPGGKVLERQGSGAKLRDVISLSRPGMLPPLNVNLKSPLPNIGENQPIIIHDEIPETEGDTSENETSNNDYDDDEDDDSFMELEQQSFKGPEYKRKFLQSRSRTLQFGEIDSILSGMDRLLFSQGK